MKRSFLFLAAGILSVQAIHAQSSAAAQAVDNSFQEFAHNLGVNGTSRAITTITAFSSKEDTKGSRYLFDHWVNGSAVSTMKDVSVNSQTLLFNYDKITHNLYITQDKKTVVEVDKNQIQSFTLHGDGGQDYAFERVNLINTDQFFQPLVKSGDKYTLYKLTKTTFKKADYHSDGLTESGHNYDEYVENSEFYILFPGGKEYKKIELKKKSIKDALSPAAARVNDYFSGHKYDDINESFLKGLVSVINQ